MNWTEFFDSGDSVDASVRKAATRYDTCPVGQYHPEHVYRILGRYDYEAKPDCPPKLRKLATQFMDAADEGDVLRMRDVHGRIREWRGT